MTPDMTESPTLGVLQLAHVPLSYPGTLGYPQTFAYPVAFLQVEAAWLEAVMRIDDAVGDGFVAGAKQLAERGVAAITTNCGLTAVFQDRIANAVSVPVATSSLMQLPLLAALLPKWKRIGILTYDAARLGENVLVAAGYRGRRSDVAIAGIEGTKAWAELATPAPDVEPARLETDLLAVVRRLVEREPHIGALLLECGAFCPYASKLRAATGLPVFDFMTLNDYLMASVATAPPGRKMPRSSYLRAAKN